MNLRKKAFKEQTEAMNFAIKMNDRLHQDGHPGLKVSECETYRRSGYTAVEAAEACLYHQYQER